MNIRNLLLGSLAVAGLSTTGAYAADLGVLTSLDVCDSLGLSGLTISSDTNCLQITGEVRYQFNWGDYNASEVDVETIAGDFNLPEGGFSVADEFNNDWESRLRAWIQFVATADTDFGPAKAVLKLRQETRVRITNENMVPDGTDADSLPDGLSTGDTTSGVELDEAYVSIGDSTVIMAGKKGSIYNSSDDAPLNWLGLFNSEKVDVGVENYPDDNGRLDNLIKIGGHVIQVKSAIADGFTIGGGLENLNDTVATRAGTAVGVLEYKGEGISAHASVAAGGILDGEVEAWAAHAGFAGTFDAFKVVLAGAWGHVDDLSDRTVWNVVASASATFDLFTLAASFEAAHQDEVGLDETDYGFGASATFAVSEGVKLNLGGRWYHDDTDGDDSYQVAAGVEAAVTETLSVTGEVGYLTDDHDDLFYGKAKLAWAPGGGYTASVAGTVTSLEGYKIETDFKKTFE